MPTDLSHLEALEAESVHIIREATAEARNPVMLFSAGKDSTVMAHLAMRAFHPSPPPFPLLHIDSTWEFRSLLEFRDAFARDNGFRLIVAANEEGRAAGLNPFDHGDRYTTQMRTEPLKTALREGGYDIVFGGARRDEEKSRAKERVVSIRTPSQGWEPRSQNPELWRLYNARSGKDGSARVFPLSNWTETDIWLYALWRGIALVPLYYAADRPVVQRAGTYIVVDDPSRMRLSPQDRITQRRVRFRTLGCWPVTGAIESEADDLRAIVSETLLSAVSERQGRISDGEDGGSLEQKKREGYF